jgi:large subunit ribosomal protein L21
MFAVVRTGGKQLRVAPGESVRVEKLDGAIGDTVELDEVLLVGGEGDARIGMPLVQGVKVVGTITDQARGPKLTIFKMKRRKGYRRKAGHRQPYTEIRSGKLTQRPGQPGAAARRQGVRRSDCDGRLDPGSTGGHANPPRSQRGPGSRLHPVRPVRRRRELRQVPRPRRRASRAQAGIVGESATPTSVGRRRASLP